VIRKQKNPVCFSALFDWPKSAQKALKTKNQKIINTGNYYLTGDIF